MSRDFLNPDSEIEKHEFGNLPHWMQGDVLQFVTFRLADALPGELVQRWRQDSVAFRKTWPPPWPDDVAAEYHHKFTRRLERWLDAASGSCLFRCPDKRGSLS